MKESIKESASERRQELPAGTGAAPLCQPLKSGADYRDATATLKMKRSRRLWGDRITFLAVAMAYTLRRRREHGLDARFLYIHIKQLILSKFQSLHDNLSPHICMPAANAFKMSTAIRCSFSFLLFRRNKRKNQPRM